MSIGIAQNVSTREGMRAAVLALAERPAHPDGYPMGHADKDFFIGAKLAAGSCVLLPVMAVTATLCRSIGLPSDLLASPSIGMAMPPSGFSTRSAE